MWACIHTDICAILMYNNSLNIKLFHFKVSLFHFIKMLAIARKWKNLKHFLHLNNCNVFRMNITIRMYVVVRNNNGWKINGNGIKSPGRDSTRDRGRWFIDTFFFHTHCRDFYSLLIQLDSVSFYCNPFFFFARWLCACVWADVEIIPLMDFHLSNVKNSI